MALTIYRISPFPRRVRPAVAANTSPPVADCFIAAFLHRQHESAPRSLLAAHLDGGGCDGEGVLRLTCLSAYCASKVIATALRHEPCSRVRHEPCSHRSASCHGWLARGAIRDAVGSTNRQGGSMIADALVWAIEASERGFEEERKDERQHCLGNAARR